MISWNIYLLNQRTLTTVQLTSCLSGLDMTKQVNLLFIQHKQSNLIQIKYTRSQLHSANSRYGECSLIEL